MLKIKVLLFASSIEFSAFSKSVSNSSINIGYGEAGVLFKTFGGGVVTDQQPLGEGFHIIAPWNQVYIYNVKQQEFFEGNMQVLSSNGLEISLDVSRKLSFHFLNLFPLYIIYGIGINIEIHQIIDAVIPS